MSLCIEYVADSWGRDFRCDNRAKYGDYCGIHSPEQKAKRAAKRGPTQFERECAARKVRKRLLDVVLMTARHAAERHPDLPGRC